MMDWKLIEEALCKRAEDVCRHLFPNGKQEGTEYVVGSLSGEKGHSLKVNLTGKLGVWCDFASNERGNRLLGLWLKARNLSSFREALVEAKQFLNIADDEPRQRVRRAIEPEDKPDESNWKAVVEVWKQCQPLTEGGPVWKYLTGKRGLDGQVLAAYDVREYLSKNRWVMVFPYYGLPEEDVVVVEFIEKKEPVPAWLKFEALDRKEGKKMEWTSRAPEKSLFGVQLDAHPVFRRCRNVLICEGEKDALTWASYGCAQWGILPVSVPFGAKWKGQEKNRPSPNREWLDRCWDWLDNFETVFVQMDGDEPGQRAAADIITEIGPRRCRLVTLPKTWEVEL